MNVTTGQLEDGRWLAKLTDHPEVAPEYGESCREAYNKLVCRLIKPEMERVIAACDHEWVDPVPFWLPGSENYKKICCKCGHGLPFNAKAPA